METIVAGFSLKDKDHLVLTNDLVVVVIFARTVTIVHMKSAVLQKRNLISLIKKEHKRYTMSLATAYWNDYILPLLLTQVFAANSITVNSHNCVHSCATQKTFLI